MKGFRKLGEPLFSKGLTQRLALGTRSVAGGVSDTTAPTVAITCNKTSPTGESPMTFTATFSENVTGFVIGDFGIANGTKGTFTAVSASVYTLAVTPDAFGNVTATIAAGVCTDAAGNANEEATPLVIFYGIFDPNGMANGALPSPWTGSTYAIATNVVVNTPTEGSDLLTDGGLENWTSPTNLTSWTETIAGTSTVNQETSVIHGGSNAARLDVDASNSEAKIKQGAAGFSVGDWVAVRFWAKASSAGKTMYTSADDEQFLSMIASLTTSYTAYLATGRCKTLTGTTLNLNFGNLSAASASLYVDDISAKKITTTTLFATINAGAADVAVKGAWTILAGQAGVVINLDSTSNPQNYVYLLHNGVATIQLFKCVGGTHSLVASAGGVTYSANANIEIRKTAATTYQVWYNGSQIGTDQTISDAGIVSNTIHGIMSTGGGNTLNRFFVG